MHMIVLALALALCSCNRLWLALYRHAPREQKSCRQSVSLKKTQSKCGVCRAHQSLGIAAKASWMQCTQQALPPLARACWRIERQYDMWKASTASGMADIDYILSTVCFELLLSAHRAIRIDQYSVANSSPAPDISQFRYKRAFTIARERHCDTCQ